MLPSSLVHWLVVGLLHGALALPETHKNEGLTPAELLPDEYIVKLRDKVSANDVATLISKVRMMLEDANRLKEIERKENDLPPIPEEDKYRVHWAEPSSFGAKIDDSTMGHLKKWKKERSLFTKPKVKSIVQKARQPEIHNAADKNTAEKVTIEKNLTVVPRGVARPVLPAQSKSQEEDRNEEFLDTVGENNSKEIADSQEKDSSEDALDTLEKDGSEEVVDSIAEADATASKPIEPFKWKWGLPSSSRYGLEWLLGKND